MNITYNITNFLFYSVGDSRMNFLEEEGMIEIQLHHYISNLLLMEIMEISLFEAY